MLILLSALAQGATLTVGPMGQYAELSQALDAAESGDTIFLAAGSHSAGTVSLDQRALHIVGADTVEVQLSASFVLENGASLVLEELSLQGDSDLVEATDATVEILRARMSPSAGFNAISASTSEVRITDSEVQGGVYALSMLGGNAAIEDSRFFETSIQAQDAESVTIWDSWIQDSPEAAFHSTGAAWVEVQGSSFVDNQGGLHLSETTAFQVMDSAFVGNQAAQGGAIYVDAESGAASGLRFEDNQGEEGGAVYIAVTSGAVRFSESSFSENIATSGGGLYVASESAELVLQDLNFTANQAQDGGAAWGASSVVLQGASVRSNSASNQGGGVYGLAVHGSELFDNSAAEGGAYVGKEIIESWLVSNVASNNGGGAVAMDGVLDVQGSTLSMNSAEGGSGGGIYAYGGDSPSVTLSETRLLNNSACANGGGLMVDLALKVEMLDLHIDGNQADLCGSEGAGGGAWVRSEFSGNTRIKLIGARFCANQADSGGGLYLKNGSGSKLRQLGFVENVATDLGGGAVFQNLSETELSNAAFVGNSARSGGGLFAERSGVAVSNTLVAYQEGGRGLAMTTGAWEDSTISTSLFYSNSPGDISASAGIDLSADGNLSADPELKSFTADGLCSDALWPTLDSPMMDAGAGTDRNGSQADIGVHGGLTRWEKDFDGDGERYESDCDDFDAQTHAEGVELCDLADRDCDGQIDEDAADASTWYQDADGDGFGDPGVAQAACSAPEGFVDNAWDCDDSDSAMNPSAAEVCDGVDNDCDGEIDPGSSEDAIAFYVDADGDGRGSMDMERACALEAGLAEESGDCDDDDAAIGPDAEETPYDGIDQDCDGADMCDADLDGLEDAACGGLDCDDGDALIGECEIADTGAPEDTGSGEADPAGCGGCSSSGDSPAPWALLGMLGVMLGLRRRD